MTQDGRDPWGLRRNGSGPVVVGEDETSERHTSRRYGVLPGPTQSRRSLVTEVPSCRDHRSPTYCLTTLRPSMGLRSTGENRAPGGKHRDRPGTGNNPWVSYRLWVSNPLWVTRSLDVPLRGSRAFGSSFGDGSTGDGVTSGVVLRKRTLALPRTGVTATKEKEKETKLGVRPGYWTERHTSTRSQKIRDRGPGSKRKIWKSYNESDKRHSVSLEDTLLCPRFLSFLIPIVSSPTPLQRFTPDKYFGYY